MTVRNAKYEDMALAASIMVTSFRTAFADFVSPETMDACTNPGNCRAMLESIYQEGKMHFLMGGDQGFLCWQETEECAEIVAIHSLPESWGTGLGHAMLTEALTQIGDRPVCLWAFKKNTRARRFYEKHSFHWDGGERVSEFDDNMEIRYVRKRRGMILETERLFLRELSYDDFDALYLVLADSDTMAHYPYTFDEVRVRNWITRNMERYRNDGFGLWAVVLKRTGEMIGDCGITMQNINGHVLPEVGYHIRKDHWKKGYASEAARACICWAFETQSFNRVYSYMKCTNIASQRTAMKNGMRFIEKYSDPDNDITTVYAISREEWETL